MLLTLCGRCGNLCRPEQPRAWTSLQDFNLFWKLLRPQNQHLQDRNFPYQDGGQHSHLTAANFLEKVGKFLGKYLGLSLHIRKLRRVEVQPLIDKIGARLPGWKGRLLSTAGRETLVKTVLSAQPIYHMTMFPEQKWLIKRIDRLRRSFLWRGETPDKVYGALHCQLADDLSSQSERRSEDFRP